MLNYNDEECGNFFHSAIRNNEITIPLENTLFLKKQSLSFTANNISSLDFNPLPAKIACAFA
jgi:hypothetical protein